MRLPHSKSKVTERRCNRDRGRTEREQGSSRDIVENRREIVVEFGSVAVGTSTQKLIELKNVSAVSLSLIHNHAYTHVHVHTTGGSKLVHSPFKQLSTESSSLYMHSIILTPASTHLPSYTSHLLPNSPLSPLYFCIL